MTNGAVFDNTSQIGGYQVQITSPTNGQIIIFQSSTNTWINHSGGGGGGVTSLNTLTGDLTLESTDSSVTITPSGTTINLQVASSGGVASLNSLTGALSVTTPNSTLSIGTSGGIDVTADINESHTNLWLAIQKFIIAAGTSGILVSNNASAVATINQGISLVEDGVPSTIANTCFGVSGNTNSPAIAGFAARGTLASPTAVQAGDLLASIKGGGYNGTAFFTGAKGYFRIYAGETWSGTASGTYLSFGTTTLTTVTPVERVRLTDTILHTVLPLQIGGTIGTPVTANQFWTSTLGAASTAMFIGNSQIATLAVANTWTALQKFTNADLALLGTSTGYTLLESGLTSTSNNTLTLPITASDTLAALATLQTWIVTQTYTPGSGSAIALLGVPAIGGATVKPSPQLDYLGHYWTGSVSVPFGFSVYTSVTATTPAASWGLYANNNGSLAQMLAVSTASGAGFTFYDYGAGTPTITATIYQNSGVPELALYHDANTITQLVPVNLSGSIQDGALSIQTHGGAVNWNCDIVGNIFEKANHAFSVVTYSGNTTLGTSSFGGNTSSIVLVDATSAPVTITMSGTVQKKGAYFTIIKIDASANAVTVSRAGTDTIEGATTVSLPAQYSKCSLISDGANPGIWYNLSDLLV